MRELARRTARRSYPLTKWRQLRKMEKSRGTPIVVFCMAKTASSALARAVTNAVPNTVFKIHMLAPDSIAAAEANYRQTDPNARPSHLWQSEFLSQRLPTPERPWMVVTIVREPVARSASEFFQSAERFGRLRDRSTATTLFEKFATHQGIPRTVGWFDREFAPSIGIGVYDHPFDPAQGYSFIETPAVRVLLLRRESLEVASHALHTLLGLDGRLEIARENVGSDKKYSELYAAVVRDARISEAALDLAYDSRFCRHFYSPEEIVRFRRTWAGAGRPAEFQ